LHRGNQAALATTITSYRDPPNQITGRAVVLTETRDNGGKKYRTGCLVPLGLYLAVLVTGYLVTRPALITEDFSGPTSHSFSVAVVAETDGGYRYGRQTLDTIRERDPELPSLRYLLPQQRVTIDVGDIHHATVLEDHDDWQLIEYDYSNTYMATSVYRAYADRIEPVSYQMTSSVGDAIGFMAVTIIALLLYLLAASVNYVRNRRNKAVRAGH